MTSSLSVNTTESLFVLSGFRSGFSLRKALKLWVISSVGLEHYLDRVGVTGSNPVLLTEKEKLITCNVVGFFIESIEPNSLE
jgi:hypothetical protein